jgi:hypothetical protein
VHCFGQVTSLLDFDQLKWHDLTIYQILETEIPAILRTTKLSVAPAEQPVRKDRLWFISFWLNNSLYVFDQKSFAALCDDKKLKRASHTTYNLTARFGASRRSGGPRPVHTAYSLRLGGGRNRDSMSEILVPEAFSRLVTHLGKGVQHCELSVLDYLEIQSRDSTVWVRRNVPFLSND